MINITKTETAEGIIYTFTEDYQTNKEENINLLNVEKDEQESECNWSQRRYL